MAVGNLTLPLADGRQRRNRGSRRAQKPRPASSRRIGAEKSRTRGLLLDASEQLMLEEGYAAVTSRRLAGRAGLKPQLVHYYFRTMEDLFLAVFRRHAEKALACLADITSSGQPLRALWDLSVDPEDSRLIMEFTALANRQKAIRSELARYGERYRSVQIDVLSRIFERYGLIGELYSPCSLAVVLTALARHLVVEESMGMRGGHAETRVLVEHFIRRLEGTRKPTKAGRVPPRAGK